MIQSTYCSRNVEIYTISPQKIEMTLGLNQCHEETKVAKKARSGYTQGRSMPSRRVLRLNHDKFDMAIVYSFSQMYSLILFITDFSKIFPEYEY